MGHAGGVQRVGIHGAGQSGAVEDFWEATLATVRERVTARQFDAWFRNTRAGVVGAGRVEVLVPSLHVRDWLERKYTGLVQTAVSQNTGWNDPEIRFVLDDARNPARQGRKPRRRAPPRSRWTAPRRMPGWSSTRPTPSKTSSSGPHNEIAVAAARSIVQHDVRNYNPLFIYGHVGLGKTHLLQAICHGLLSRPAPADRLRLVRALHQPVHLRDREGPARRVPRASTARPRSSSSTTSTSSRTRTGARKSSSTPSTSSTSGIARSSCRAIRRRSRSRPCPSAWSAGSSRGWSASSSRPLYETRMQIAKGKAAQPRIGASRTTSSTSSPSSVQTNVRDLHGAVTRVIGVSSLKNIPVSLPMAQQVLGRPAAGAPAADHARRHRERRDRSVRPPASRAPEQAAHEGPHGAAPDVHVPRAEAHEPLARGDRRLLRRTRPQHGALRRRARGVAHRPRPRAQEGRSTALAHKLGGTLSRDTRAPG